MQNIDIVPNQILNQDRSKSTLNMSRCISNSSKKSIQERKDDFKERVQKLKSKLDSTKNSMKQKKEFINQRYNQTATFSNSGFGNNVNNYTMVNDGSVSPTSLGATSACGNYQINHVRSNTGGLSNSFYPHIVVRNNCDLNKVHNLSYYSSVGNGKKLLAKVATASRKEHRKDAIQEYKLDGATLLVSRIKNQIKKHFNALKNFGTSGRRITDMKYAHRASVNASYTEIQPEINRQRNLSKENRNSSRISSTSKPRDKSVR